MPHNPSPAQQEASRRNGAQSHGPQDTSHTRFNALRHGLLSEGLVFTSEEQQRRFIMFHHDLVADLGPEGPLEDLLVERLATCYQRLGRAAQLIAFWSLPSPEQRTAIYEGALVVNFDLLQQANLTTTGATLIRYERALDRELYTALKTLQSLQTRRRSAAAFRSSVLARLRGETQTEAPSAVPDACPLPPPDPAEHPASSVWVAGSPEDEDEPHPASAHSAPPAPLSLAQDEGDGASHSLSEAEGQGEGRRWRGSPDPRPSSPSPLPLPEEEGGGEGGRWRGSPDPRPSSPSPLSLPEAEGGGEGGQWRGSPDPRPSPPSPLSPVPAAEGGSGVRAPSSAAVPDACPPLGSPEQSGPADALSGQVSGSFRSTRPEPDPPSDAFTQELLAALEGRAEAEGWSQPSP